MTLIEIVCNLESFDNEGIICATKPWTENSQGIVVLEPEAGRLPAQAERLGMDYFLEVLIARDFLEGWKATFGTEPTLEETCARLIKYASTDA